MMRDVSHAEVSGSNKHMYISINPCGTSRTFLSLCSIFVNDFEQFNDCEMAKERRRLAVWCKESPNVICDL